MIQQNEVLEQALCHAMPAMRPRSRNTLLALATAFVLVLALILILDRPASRSSTGASTTTTGTESGVDVTASGFDGALLPSGVSAPDFTLTDQHGRRISLAQYRGQVAILTFLATNCAPTCPLVAQQIRGALDELGRPVPTLIVSTDPAADTPAAVRRFLAEAALTGRAEYLTGAPTELRRIWRAYSVVPAQLADADSSHPAEVLLIDRAGGQRDLFQVEQLTPEGLAHDVRRLEG
jgi:protein SCO1